MEWEWVVVNGKYTLAQLSTTKPDDEDAFQDDIDYGDYVDEEGIVLKLNDETIEQIVEGILDALKERRK